MASFYEVALAEIALKREEYEQECRDYAEQGHGPHYCIHGTDLWVDYDNICGGCEAGLTDEQEAQAIADEREAAVGQIVDAARAIYAIRMLTYEDRTRIHAEIIERVTDRLTEWSTLPADRV